MFLNITEISTKCQKNYENPVSKTSQIVAAISQKPTNEHQELPNLA